MLKPSDYCELDRRFVQFKHEAGTDDYALHSYSASPFYLEHGWGSMGWDDLIQKGGTTVVLGEPGSGRSYEFKARCQQLTEQGAAAFYLELHRLVGAAPAQILDGLETARFQAWQRSREKAVFFLDAVDEAKLERVSDFGLALERFATALGVHRRRATVFISSRISEWSPEADLRLVKEKLPAFADEVKKQGGSSQWQAEEPNREIPVYVIAPLSRQQVSMFAQALGAAEGESFLAALDQRHAWEFARRPSDVSFLVQYWKRHGQIGSLTEMLEESLSMLLTERQEKRHRAVKFPLSMEQARLGAEALAAATLFCRTLDFEVSDIMQGSRPGLRPLDCLPAQWTKEQCMALLDRPLFDSAIYGRVRFHHRRLAEYLAACWLRRRMENQCPTPVLHDMLFIQLPGGRRVIRPSRAPVAVWLACIGQGAWAIELRSWLLDASPHSFLRYGDPARLPIAFRQQIIDAFVDRFKDRTQVRLETDAGAMTRLADPELAASLSRHILAPEVGVGIKTELLDFAKHGCAGGCAGAALALLRSAPADRHLVHSAIELIAESGSSEVLSELAALVRADQKMAASHADLIASVLFPAHMDISALHALLSIRQSSSNCWRLQRLFTQKPVGWCLFAVLEMLVELALHDEKIMTDPDFEAEEWSTDLITPLIKAIMEGRELRPEYLDAVARACWILIKRQPDMGRPGSLKGIAGFEESTRRFPELRRALFWLAVRQNEKKDLHRYIACFLFRDTLHFTFCEDDCQWLLKDTADQSDKDAREVAAWLIFDQWQSRRVSSKNLSRLFDSIRDLPDLYREISKRMWQVRKARFMGWWYWLLHKGMFDKWRWKMRFKAIKRTPRSWRDTWHLHTRIRHMRSGKYVGWLSNLAAETSGDSRWAVSDWSKLIAKRGRRITRAVQEGCVAVWQSYEPGTIKSSDGTPCGVVAGLCGLQFLYQNKRLDFARLLSVDANRAARYAVNEMNGYSEWLVELAEHHPEPVRDVLMTCIEHEWHAQEQNGFWPMHLHCTGKKDSALAHLVSESVLKLVEGSPPANLSVLSAALGLLIRHNGIEREHLARLSAQRLASTCPGAREYLTWLVVCLQTNAAVALDHLEQLHRDEMEGALSKPESNFMVVLCSELYDRGVGEWLPRIANPDHLRAEHAPRFIRLVYTFVDPAKDIKHAGGVPYTPGPRDDAQGYRSAILGRLSEQSDPLAEAALRSLLTLPELEESHDWIRHLIDERLERMADGAAFQARDIPLFEQHNEAAPRSAADLFQIVLRRLRDIKHDVEQADQSLRKSVRKGDLEVDLRRFVALQLSTRSNGCYTAPQESVIRDEKRLDIRVENPGVSGPVVIEVKLGDQSERTLESLLADLEGQLVQRYLHDEHSRHGIYLIGYTGGRKYWEHPDTGKRLSFSDVISILQQKAEEIQAQNPAVESLKVIGIDFCPPAEPVAVLPHEGTS